MENTKGKIATGIAKKFVGCNDMEKSKLSLYILGMYEGNMQGKKEVLQALEEHGITIPPDLFNDLGNMTPASP